MTPEKRHVHLQKNQEKFQQISTIFFPRWLPDFPLPIPTCLFHLKNMSPWCSFFMALPDFFFFFTFSSSLSCGKPNSQVIQSKFISNGPKVAKSMTRKNHQKMNQSKISPKIPIIKCNTNNYPSFPQLFCSIKNQRQFFYEVWTQRSPS